MASALLVMLAAAVAGCNRHDATHPSTPVPLFATAASADGADLIGTPAPPWEVTDWLNSPPLTLAALKGKVVLIRWFMSTDCPYCTATAPALNELHREFGGRGLIVVGMYHHKNAEPLDVKNVAGWAHDFGFRFPVAVDRDWRTLRRWWLNGGKRDFTSVSFLIDAKGIIRRIHPGGTMALGSKDYDGMKAAIENLLAE
jgi:peroxiredoxin